MCHGGSERKKFELQYKWAREMNHPIVFTVSPKAKGKQKYKGYHQTHPTDLQTLPSSFLSLITSYFLMS